MENKVNSKISTCDLPACTVLVYRNKVQNGNFPPACRAAMTRFHAFASQHDLRPCFGPSAVGVGIAPAELGSMPEFYEAGCMMRNDVPVRELVPNVITGLAAKEPGEGFFIREVPAGTWAKYLLRGSFEQLAAAYPALAKWVQDSGKWMMDPNRAAYEKYVKMGEDVPEAEQETEVLLPIVPITTEVK